MNRRVLVSVLAVQLIALLGFGLYYVYVVKDQNRPSAESTGNLTTAASAMPLSVGPFIQPSPGSCASRIGADRYALITFRSGGAFAVNAETNGREQFTLQAPANFVAISPDGSRAAYWHMGPAPDFAPPSELVIADLAGCGAETTWVRLDAERGGSIVWSGDGRSIAFAVNAPAGGPTSIRTIGFGDHAVRELAKVSGVGRLLAYDSVAELIGEVSPAGGDGGFAGPYRVIGRSGEISTTALPGGTTYYSVMGSPDGTRVLSVSQSENTVRVWPLANPGAATSLRPTTTQKVRNAAFLAGSSDLVVQLDVGVERWAGTAPSRVIFPTQDVLGTSSGPVFARPDGTAALLFQSSGLTRWATVIDLSGGPAVRVDLPASPASLFASVSLARGSTPPSGQGAPCRSDQLSGTYENNGAAAGSLGSSFRLALAAGSCVVPAGPQVRFFDANGALILSATSPASGGPAQTIRAGAVGKDSAFLGFQWSLHGTEPGYRCVTMGPQVASVAVDLGRTALAASDVLRLDIPAAQRFSFCADPPERVSASIIGSRQP